MVGTRRDIRTELMIGEDDGNGKRGRNARTKGQEINASISSSTAKRSSALWRRVCAPVAHMRVVGVRGRFFSLFCSRSPSPPRMLGELGPVECHARLRWRGREGLLGEIFAPPPPLRYLLALLRDSRFPSPPRSIVFGTRAEIRHLLIIYAVDELERKHAPP